MSHPRQYKSIKKTSCQQYETIHLYDHCQGAIKYNGVGVQLWVCMLLLYTNSHDHASGESDFAVCGPPVRFSVHMTSSPVTPAGSVHKSRGYHVVRMCVQLQR